MAEFKHMRLAENQMTDEDARKQLEKASHGTLALVGDNGYPVTIPIKFVYKDNKILFHGANDGQKYTLIKAAPKASSSVQGGTLSRPRSPFRKGLSEIRLQRP